jgi:hypothetical protein
VSNVSYEHPVVGFSLPEDNSSRNLFLEIKNYLRTIIQVLAIWIDNPTKSELSGKPKSVRY